MSIVLRCLDFCGSLHAMKSPSTVDSVVWYRVYDSEYEEAPTVKAMRIGDVAKRSEVGIETIR